ncbi:bacteriochlorophyll 4-vinyl reductase [Falsiroseomonas sp.]|uniref:bacteriochlorophyll 4-vinyl reductase n=1 Tax=Falsiroseomonas sp. TaxID=2870721 RepID=UPI003F6ECBE2
MTPASIGPNAVLQLDAVLALQDGEAARQRVFGRAGLQRHLVMPPTRMVAETEVAALFAALRDEFGEPAACHRAAAAGAATARYLLAHRIPRPLRLLLPRLPARIAAPVLGAAIRRHGWTFLGSGALELRHGRPLHIHIRLATCLEAVAPVAAAFYRMTFLGLYRALVSARIQARPGPGPCDFDLAW